MTFLATRDGELVAGGRSPWPKPWGFRCDGCGCELPYGSILMPSERRTSSDQARQMSHDVHRCGACEGYVDQPGLGL